MSCAGGPRTLRVRQGASHASREPSCVDPSDARRRSSRRTGDGAAGRPLARPARGPRLCERHDLGAGHAWGAPPDLARRLCARPRSAHPRRLADGGGSRLRDGACLAARSSASARGLQTAWSTIDVITPKRRGVELPGIRAHRVTLRPEERDVHRGLPVTSLAWTALDVAACEGFDRVGELLDRALLDGQYDHSEMTELLDARIGCRGMATLRRTVAPSPPAPEGRAARPLGRDRHTGADSRSPGVRQRGARSLLGDTSRRGLAEASSLR